MKKQISQLLRIFALLFTAVAMCCCADDRESYERPGGEKQKEVTFAVQIPVPSLPSTYGLNATSENQVNSIDILLFNSGTGNLTGSTLSANSIANSGTNSSTKTFTVKIPEGSYQVVILANCRDILTAAMPAINGLATKSKANVLEKLSLSHSTVWVANSGSGSYKPFPMWGEMPLTVSSSMPATNNMKLTRMLAKIDVSVNGSLRNDFELTSVRLYNRYTQGSVAPLAANWSSTQNKVTAPSPLGTKTAAALAYTVATPFAEYKNEIYTFEAAAGASGTLASNTCLVIGGKYKGSPDETYYRIDFVKKTGNTVTYLPLLRNHRYDVDIKTIEAVGYASPGEAFAAKPVNIKADITAFDESKITKTVYDDQYMLGVSDNEITFTREARTATSLDNTLSVTTDVPGGWKVDKVIDAGTLLPVSWVSLSPNNSSTGGTSDTKLILSENTSGSSRSAVIHLVAGRLTLPVTITQTTAATFMLSLTNTSDVEITELVFASQVGLSPNAQPVRLRWMPIDRAVSVSTAAWGGNPAFKYHTISSPLSTPGEGSETSYSDPLGVKYLTIQPDPITAAELTGNPFLERISKVDFTVSNGAGGYIAKSVFLRQFAYNFVVEQTTGFYRLDGSTYTLRVKSNTGWKISSISESLTSGSGSLLNLAASDNLRTTTSGGANTNPGTDIKFRVTNNVTNLRGKLTIKFESTDSPKRFNDYTLVLDLMGEYYPTPHTGWAGSNIYWNGSELTFDNVGVTTHQNYQGVFFQWGSLWGIDPSGSQNSAWTNRVYKLNNGSYTYTSASWNTFPRVNDATITSNPPSGKSDRDRAYLYEVTDGTSGIGDICKYLTDRAGGTLYGSKWRMPTSQEFESAGSYSRSGTSWSTVTSGSETGVYQNPAKPGYSKTATSQGTYPTAFFPASGYRANVAGVLSYVGSLGYYWSGSPGGPLGYHMTFSSSVINPGNRYTRMLAFAVRCVRE